MFAECVAVVEQDGRAMRGLQRRQPGTPQGTRSAGNQLSIVFVITGSGQNLLSSKEHA